MTAQKGRNVLIKYYNGTSYVTVGGARDSSIAINNEAVDITNCDDSGVRKLLEGAGVTSISLKLSGVYVEDAAFAAMKTDALTNAHRNYQFVLPGVAGGTTFQGSFMIQNFGLSGTYKDAAMQSLTLESAGPVTTV